MNNWIKTDDMQYVNKIKDGVYQVAEARYAEDKYLLCKGKVIISNWIDSDSNYDADCRAIICTYYDSVEAFCNCYFDMNTREQVLAEMIFECTPYFETEWTIVTEEGVEKELQRLLQ